MHGSVSLHFGYQVAKKSNLLFDLLLQRKERRGAVAATSEHVRENRASLEMSAAIGYNRGGRSAAVRPVLCGSYQHVA